MVFGAYYVNLARTKKHSKADHPQIYLYLCTYNLFAAVTWTLTLTQ